MKSKNSFERCTAKRRSVRAFTDKPIKLKQLSQLLWAAQGITNDKGYRTVPSAGAKFPIELYIVVTDVYDLETGIYHYDPTDHTIQMVAEGNRRDDLGEAALKQKSLLTAPVALIVTGVIDRVAEKYGERATQYTYIEAGSICQNVYLQCESLGLGTVVMGAFHDDQVIEFLQLDKSEYTPLLIMPVGNI